MITSSVVFKTGLVLSGSSAVTGSSFLWNGDQIVTSLNLVTTTSFHNFTSSYSTGSFTGSFNGDLLGTSSYADLALLALNSSYYTSPLGFVLCSQLGTFFGLGTYEKSAPCGGAIGGVAGWGTDLSVSLPNTQSEALVQHPAPYPCRVIGMILNKQNSSTSMSIYLRKNGIDTEISASGSIGSGNSIWSYNTASTAIFGPTDLMSLRIRSVSPAGAGDIINTVTLICSTNL
jgi:hypothetical protein